MKLKIFITIEIKWEKKIKKASQMLNRFEFEKNCYKYLFLVNKYI